MGKIIILDEHTANKIAAGEVVERPASIVKELCENSIDAGATSITVEIKNGGISYIKIVDNGSGIAKDDVEIAFEKHSTSKIRSADDLCSIATMGFRGEALASIAAVARVELSTKTVGDTEGSKITAEGGSIGKRQDTGCPVGTSIVIRNLFFNTPARYKFLKKDYTEAGYVEDVVTRLALGYPGISFKYINNGSLVMQTPGNNDLTACAYSIFGNMAKSTVRIEYEENGIEAKGLAGKPEIARSNRSHQIFFINNRFIRNKTMTAAAEEAYKTLLQVGKYPFVILNIRLNPQLVDVNVHPTKQEVRFSDENMIFSVVYHAVKNALLGGTSLVPEFSNSAKAKDNFRFKPLEESPNEYMQGKLNLKPVQTQQKSIFTSGLRNSNYGNNYKGFSKDFSEGGDCDHQTEKAFKPDVEVEAVKRNFTPEIKEQSENYLSFKIVGTVFSTYILVEFNDEMYMIDQHAAHERVMFETLRKEIKSGARLSQMLIVPEIAELTNKEIKLIEENKELLTNIGFITEEFGKNAVKINSVPLVCDKADVKEIFLYVIDGLVEARKDTTKVSGDALLYRLACKSAVKANTNLSREEISGLLNSMMDLENPYTCPHGRPTAIKMTKHEIEKRFGRT